MIKSRFNLGNIVRMVLISLALQSTTSLLYAFEGYPTVSLSMIAPPGEVIIPDYNTEIGFRTTYPIRYFVPENQVEVGLHNGKASYAVNLSANLVYSIANERLKLGGGLGVSMTNVLVKGAQSETFVSPSTNINIQIFKVLFFNAEVLLRSGLYSKFRVGIRVF